MTTFELVCMILRDCAERIHKQGEHAMNPDYRFGYDESEEIVNNCLHDFMDGYFEEVQKK
jgi:hypothetical protein